MTLTTEEVKKIAHLARLNLSQAEIEKFTPQLSSILKFVEQMDKVDTAHVEPLSHAFETSQRLRPDAIIEVDLRDKFQQIAPQVEVGLYLVPKVIEEA